MVDESQIEIPPSFVALFVPEGRIKPTASRLEIQGRYELCEDLASALTEQAQTLLWQLSVTRYDVLHRIRLGLVDPQSGLGPAEAAWTVRRLAELLGWEDPGP